MKQSGIDWIGEIPDDWKINQLSQIVFQVKNKNTGLKENNLLSLSYGKIKRKNINTNDGLLPASFDGYNIISDGDIVLRLTDLQNDHTSLRVGRATEQGIITSAYTTLHPVDYDNSKYLYYILHSFDLKKGFYGMGSGVRQGLNYDEVKTLKVPLPPKATQQRIAEYLDSKCAQIDSIIEESKKSIEEYKAWKQSVIFEAITGKNLNCKKKDSGIEWIGEIPEGWEVKRLKNLFDFGKGLPITKENLKETGVSVISYGQIHSKQNSGTRIDDSLKRFVDESYLTSNSNSLVHKSDFIFADTSEDLEGCGNCVYVDEEQTLFAGYHTIIFSSKIKQSNKYLAYLFKTDAWRNQIRSRCNGVKLFSITKRILSNVNVILPPLAEQESIAKMLDSKCAQIDSLVAEKESLIADLTEYKKSLIFEVVTGKRSV